MVISLKKIILPFLLFAGFLGLYVHNLSASVYSGDVGDLVTAASVGGVAHPPGYPLFTFLGFLLTHQPFLHATPAFFVGLISAFSGALGILCFYFISLRLSKSQLSSVIASCILGFSFLYWFYAEIAEVFELSIFFALLLSLLAILYHQYKKGYLLFIFFLVIGFSLTNQQTIILFIPFLFVFLAKDIFMALRKKPYLAIFYVLCSLLGLVPYVYVWIASSMHPIINWDHVHDIPSLLHLILRKDYGTFQAGVFQNISFSQRLVTLKIFFQYLLFQLTIPVVFLSLVGFWKLFTKEKLLFSSLLLACIVSGPIFLMYAGFPLTTGFVLGTYERFVILPLALFLIPLSLGLVTFVGFLLRLLPKRNYSVIFQIIFFLIPISLCMYNFPKTNLSHFFLGDNYALDYLSFLPPHAVLLVSGDTQTFNSWYVHYALHVRPDVLLYNLGATPFQDNVIAPQLVGIPQSKQGDYLVGILQRLQFTRPIFSNLKMQPKTGPKILWMPVGLSYQMIQPSQLPTKDEYKSQTLAIWSKLHAPTKQQLQQPVFHNLSVAEIPIYYADMLVSAGAFAYSQYKDEDTALSLYKKAKEIAPDDPRAYADEAVIFMSVAGKCKETAADLSTAISLDPYNEVPYFLLYNISLTCFKQKSVANTIATDYSKMFNKDFQKEYKKSGINAPLYE